MVSVGARWMMQSVFLFEDLSRLHVRLPRVSRRYASRDAIVRLDGKLTNEQGFACMADLLLNLNSLGAVIGEVPLMILGARRL